MIWFTSDTHFWHYNVLSYSHRPIYPDLPPGLHPGYKNRQEVCEDMNKVLIDNWNSKVKPTDEIYHLGDFAFCGVNKAKEILNQLNGIKYWIRGNHDHDLVKKIGDQFVWVRDYYVLKVHDEVEGKQFHQPIVMLHFPILSWENMVFGWWHIHGHTHGALKGGNLKRYDVGVDNNNLFPISYQDLKIIMATKTLVLRPEKTTLW